MDNHHPNLRHADDLCSLVANAIRRGRINEAQRYAEELNAELLTKMEVAHG